MVRGVALLVTLVAVGVARPDGGEDEASSDDLLSVFRPFCAASGGGKWSKSSREVPWTDWWYANRRNLVTPSPRAGATESGDQPEDAPARQRALAVLREALASKDRLVASEAALALGRLRDPEIVGQLRAIVTSREADMSRATAAVCLGRVGSDADLDVLLEVLADRKTADPLRPCIVHAIGWLLDRSDHAALARITSDVKWDKHVAGKNLSWTGEALWDLQHLVD